MSHTPIPTPAELFDALHRREDAAVDAAVRTVIEELRANPRAPTVIAGSGSVLEAAKLRLEQRGWRCGLTPASCDEPLAVLRVSAP